MVKHIVLFQLASEMEAERKTSRSTVSSTRWTM